MLQPLPTVADMGKVALSCHFACDALCAELYDWDEVGRCRPSPQGGKPASLPTPATRGRRLAGVEEWVTGEVSQPRGCERRDERLRLFVEGEKVGCLHLQAHRVVS